MESLGFWSEDNSSSGPSGTPGPSGPSGPSGEGSINNFSNFYALMPGDNTATIAPGAAVQFPQNGPTSGIITRTSASTFTIPDVGVYEVQCQVSVAEAGQLQVTINGVGLASTVVGRAEGTTQIIICTLITITNPNSVLSIINPVGNPVALTITPSAGGTHSVSATLIINQKLGSGSTGAPGPSGPSGPSGVPGPSGPSGPSGPAGGRPVTDAACTICWTCDEISPPYQNTGSGGTLSLNVYSDAGVSTRDGIYGGSAQLWKVSSDGKGMLVTDPTSIGESNSITVSFWACIEPVSPFSVIIAKDYYVDDSGSSPYFSIDVRFLGASATIAQWSIGVCVNGTLREMSIGSINILDGIQILTWLHICITYDSSTGILCVYRNGVLLNSRTDTPGNIDWGTHGRWTIGSDYMFSRNILGYIDDIRVESTVWSVTDVNNYYRARMGYP